MPNVGDYHLYNVIVTAHTCIMIFSLVTPVMIGEWFVKSVAHGHEHWDRLYVVICCCKESYCICY